MAQQGTPKPQPTPRSTIHGLSTMALMTGKTQMSDYHSMSSDVEVQSSVVTIFAIWNTMMGVSILSMPWGLHQAGFSFGILLLIIVGVITFYTAYLVVSSKDQLLPTEPSVYEFSDICRSLFGRPGEILSVLFSIMVLFGALLVYWVLLSNFLYFTGVLLYGFLDPHDSLVTSNENSTCHINCDEDIDSLSLTNHTTPSILFGLTFTDIWQLKRTVPIYLAVMMFPLLNFKSPTFFTKFSILGTISVAYLFCFNTTQLIRCGIHMDFTSDSSSHYVEQIKLNFPALTGMLSMSYMIHNAILTILRCQRNPENNARDLCIGYILVGLSYIFVAVTFYISFPFSRDCIHDNLLNNFDIDYPLSSLGRVLLFVQLFAIYPLLMFLVRSQLSCLLFNTPWPGYIFVLILNGITVFACVITAMFFPNVGTIVRYCGAFCGLMIVYALPCGVYLKLTSRDSPLTMWDIFFHSTLIILGLINLLAQFLL